MYGIIRATGDRIGDDSSQDMIYRIGDIVGSVVKKVATVQFHIRLHTLKRVTSRLFDITQVELCQLSDQVRIIAEKLQMKKSSTSAIAITHPTAPALDCLGFLRPFVAFQCDISLAPTVSYTTSNLSKKLLDSLSTTITQVTNCDTHNRSLSTC